MTDETLNPVAVDLDGLREELAEAGVAEILWELVETFATDAPRRMKAIDSALQSRSGREIRSAAHAYKSAAGTMRARELASLLLDLEMAGNEADLEKALALQAPIRDAHERTLEFLSDAPGEGNG